jgi:hypothetical protein
MAGKRVPANNLAGARLLEPFSRTLVGLQLWHKCPGDHPSARIGDLMSVAYRPMKKAGDDAGFLLRATPISTLLRNRQEPVNLAAFRARAYDLPAGIDRLRELQLPTRVSGNELVEVEHRAVLP